MHELSLVIEIVEKAEATVREHAAKNVDSITLRIGSMAGIEPAALEMAWASAIPQTVLEHARKIELRSEARFACLNCLLHFEANDIFAICPGCGNTVTNMISGDEFIIEQIILNI